ncbi:MAG: phosphoribosylanthranilate isomerase [Hyphomicrobiaceae bacterium]|nr:phosphoribosylanthranilate isomerase [Hyphomicrobiaceae bacterium]
MPIEIKICGLKTTATVEAALVAGADLLGFVVFPRSPRNVTPAEAHTLSISARGRAKIVALLVDPDDALLDIVVKTIAPDILQLHGHETPERCAAVKAKFKTSVMKAVGVSTAADLAEIATYRGVVDRILLDAKPPPESALPGGNGHTFDWALIADLGRTEPFMLSGGLNAFNVAHALQVTAAPAVDVSSGVETTPGVKSSELIRAFIKSVRSV